RGGLPRCIFHFAPFAVAEIAAADRSSPESRSPVRGRRARWPWFPLAWPAFLVGICLFVWKSSLDRGVLNSVIYVALGLILVGDIAWLIRRSGFGKRWRWGL